MYCGHFGNRAAVCLFVRPMNHHHRPSCYDGCTGIAVEPQVRAISVTVHQQRQHASLYLVSTHVPSSFTMMLIMMMHCPCRKRRVQRSSRLSTITERNHMCTAEHWMLQWYTFTPWLGASIDDTHRIVDRIDIYIGYYCCRTCCSTCERCYSCGKNSRCCSTYQVSAPATIEPMPFAFMMHHW